MKNWTTDKEFKILVIRLLYRILTRVCLRTGIFEQDEKLQEDVEDFITANRES